MYEFSNEFIRFERSYDKDEERRREEYSANMKKVHEWNEMWNDDIKQNWDETRNDREVYYEMEF